MKYEGGYCSTIMNARPFLTSLDRAVAQRLALTSPDCILPTASPSIRVLVAGDHASLRSSLKTMLELDPNIRVVGEAADDCETIKMARKLKPDVVLIDLDMRCCCDNFEAVAEIAERNLASSIVALTIHDDESERAAAQSAGVDLFLEKGVPYKQLIGAIRSAVTNGLANASLNGSAVPNATHEIASP